MSTINNFLKEKGFVIPSNDIYGGTKGLYDYGHLGFLLKKKIKHLWEDFFVLQESNAYFLDASILGSYDTWKASGHIDNFNDTLIDCRDCKKRFREDHLSKDKKCTNCSSTNFTNPREFNLIFKTNEDHYLRPETAQNIFINFKNIHRLYSTKIPFAVAQIGKSFRNEITLENFIFRTKEFEQMELEWFVNPFESSSTFDYCLKKIETFLFCELGISKEKIKIVEISEKDRAHYSRKSVDILFHFEHGWSELWGLANRGDFDLSSHQTHSKKSMEYFDTKTKLKFIPHVIEHSISVDRLLYALVTDKYKEYEDRSVLHLKETLCFYKFAIIPISKAEEELAKRIYDLFLKEKIYVLLSSSKDSIGKKYKKFDAIGVPYCITIDRKSREDLDNPLITIRDRDTTKQIEVFWSTFKLNEFKVNF